MKITRSDFLVKVKAYLPQDPICVEIGVYRGDFAKKIYDTLNPYKLHLIDPWAIGSDKNSTAPQYEGILNGLNTAYSDSNDLILVKNLLKDGLSDRRIILHRGFSYDEVNNFSDKYFDFVYIDATHLYESVKADLNMFLPKLKNGGIIGGHDYIEHDSFEVIKAVDEFVKENNTKLLFVSEEGDFAIQL